MRDVGRLLAGRLFGAPDAQEVVVDLEREPESPAEPAITGMTASSSVARRAPASIDPAMSAAVLRPIMSR